MQFCIMNIFSEYQLLPAMKFSFNAFPRLTLIADLLKRISDFIADVCFVRKEAFYLNVSSKKDTMMDENIYISGLK